MTPRNSNADRTGKPSTIEVNPKDSPRPLVAGKPDNSNTSKTIEIKKSTDRSDFRGAPGAVKETTAGRVNTPKSQTPSVKISPSRGNGKNNDRVDSGRPLVTGKSEALTKRDRTDANSKPLGAPAFSSGISGNSKKGDFVSPSKQRETKPPFSDSTFSSGVKSEFAGSASFSTERLNVSVAVSSCGHSVCGSRSSCGLSNDFYEPCYWTPVCDPYRYRYCDYGWWDGFGFGFSFRSGGFSIGFSWWDDWGCSNYRPSYFYHGGCYNPCYYSCHCGGSYCHYRIRYYPVYYTLPTYIYEPVYTSYSYPTYSSPTYSSPDMSYATNDGWGLLVDGNARDARRVFDRQMNAHQNDGLAHIGYAISAAMLDRDAEAVAVMRLALRIDPEAIHEVPQDQRLHDHIWVVLDRFIDRADRDPRDMDAQFMIASLRFMMGDATLSFFAIDRALDAGDTDPAAQNLRMLIRQAMEESSPFVPNAPVTPAPSAPATESATNWHVPL